MTLDQIALLNGTDKASSHHDYCRVYEPLFDPMRDKPISLLEIGVQFGNSAKTFLEYFPNAMILGADIARHPDIDSPRFHFLQGDIGDVSFWNSCHTSPFDIVIDDGPHIFESSVVAFECLWPRLNHGGLYCIEDVFTWWDSNYQTLYGRNDLDRGLKMAGWFVRLLGNLNQNGKSYFGKPTSHQPLVGMETEIEFVHFHRGLVIIKKK